MRVGSWLPHPMLSVVLLLVWLLLNDSLAPGQVLLGTTLGLLIPLFTQRFWPERASFKRPLLAAQLIVRVLLDIVIANFAVTRIVLGPAENIKPVFVRVPLDLKGEFGLTLLASVISLTPGTLSAELDTEHRYLLLHALSEEHPEQLVQQVKARYEAPLKEIFAC